MLSNNGEALFAQKYGSPNIGNVRISEIHPDFLEVVRKSPYLDCGWSVAAYTDGWLCVSLSGRVEVGFTTTVSIIGPLIGVEIKILPMFKPDRVVKAVKSQNAAELFILSQQATINVVEAQSGAVKHALLVRSPG